MQIATPVHILCEKIIAMSNLADRIKEAMDSTHVSVTQVAKTCGVSYQGVRKWRTGETINLDAGNLLALAELTGYEPKWILTGEGPRVRTYARNEAQANTLKVMEALPDNEQAKIPALAHLLAQHPTKRGNGWE